MKKYIYAGMMTALITLAGCSSEDFGPEMSQDGNVTFDVQLPVSMSSRNYSDGTTAKRLSYALYEVSEDSEGNKTYTNAASYNHQGTEAEFVDKAAKVNLSLITGRTYTIVFWADALTGSPYNLDLATGKMSITNTTADSQDENRDAFFANYTFTVNGPINEEILLRRPFAQINIGTRDLKDFTDNGGNISVSGFNVQSYTTLNLINGNVEGEKSDMTFTPVAFPGEGEVFPVTYVGEDGQEKPYEYLAMTYVLMGADKEITDVTWTSDNSSNPSVTFNSVPLQRNYQTNIYGHLLTEPGKFDIRISEPFENEHDYEYDAFKAVAAQGGNLTLSSDLNLSPNALVLGEREPVTVAAGAEMNLDLNGHFIDNAAIDVEGVLYLSGSGKIKSVGYLKESSFGTVNTPGTATIVVKNGGRVVVDEGSDILALCNNLSSHEFIKVEDGGTLIVRSAGITCSMKDDASTLAPDRAPGITVAEGGKLTVSSSTIKAGAAVINAITENPEATNATKITITNSSLINLMSWNESPYCLVIANDATVSVKKTRMEAGLVAAVIRQGNEVVFDNCEFVATGKSFDVSRYDTYYQYMKWQNGQVTPPGVVVIGNYTDGDQYAGLYPRPVNVSFIRGTTITSPSALLSRLPAIRIHAVDDESGKVTVTRSGSWTVTGNFENEGGSLSLSPEPFVQ